ncbi:MAG: DUF3810 domain-containing protein [Oscillospiraceae bacterium]|nr:DUF3810 domain-containing protein [Oscillospiraceae bacterium]
MRKSTVPLLLFALSLSSFVTAIVLPELFAGWYPELLRDVSHTLARVTGFVPFALSELFMYALPLSLILYIIISIIKRTKLRYFVRVIFTWAGALLLSFIWLYGIAYFCPAPGERMGLAGYTANASELMETAEHYRGILNASGVERGADGRTARQPLTSYNNAVINGYTRLAGTYDFIKADPAPAKGLVLDVVQSHFGISGMYIPWFAESCVNLDTPPQNLPAVIAHELAHRQGAAPEDEANFLGIMACLNSGDVNVEYSGAFLAFTYLSNALGKADPSAQARLWAGLSDAVAEDLFGVREHYAQYEGPLNDMGEKVNDTYLKAMQQEAGTQSYGMVADLLAAEYIKR